MDRCPNCKNPDPDFIRQIAPSGHDSIYRCDECIEEQATCSCGCGLRWGRKDWYEAEKKIAGNMDTELEKRWS